MLYLYIYGKAYCCYTLMDLKGFGLGALAFLRMNLLEQGHESDLRRHHLINYTSWRCRSHNHLRSHTDKLPSHFFPFLRPSGTFTVYVPTRSSDFCTDLDIFSLARLESPTVTWIRFLAITFFSRLNSLSVSFTRSITIPPSTSFHLHHFFEQPRLDHWHTLDYHSFIPL